MRTALLALLFVAASGGALAADSATLTVKLENVSPKGGNVIVAVFDAQTFAIRHSAPLAKQSVPAKAGETIVTFHDLPPGTYGLKAMQDEVGDGHMHFVLGMPTEPFGFSNDPALGMSAPDFDEAKIVVKSGENHTTITLHTL